MLAFQWTSVQIVEVKDAPQRHDPPFPLDQGFPNLIALRLTSAMGHDAGNARGVSQLGNPVYRLLQELRIALRNFCKPPLVFGTKRVSCQARRGLQRLWWVLGLVEWLLFGARLVRGRTQIMTYWSIILAAGDLHVVHHIIFKGRK